MLLGLTFAVVLGTTGPASAADSWANKVFGGQPGIDIVQDFGVVAGGTQLQATLKMTNIYKVPLTITQINVSCGCVRTEPDDPRKQNVQPITIQPNQTADFVIKMDGTKFQGHKQVTVDVTFGPQFISTATIKVKANAAQNVVLNPGSIEFETVGRGQQVARTIDVECAGIAGWKVVEVGQRNGRPPFDLKIENLPPRMANGAGIVGYRLTATLKADAAPGKFSEAIDLKTNNPGQPIVTFFVNGNVESAVVALPNNLQVPGLKVGVPSMRQVIVRGSQPFAITGIQGNDGAVKLVPSDNAMTPVHIVQVQVTPQSPGALNREFIVQTNLSGESVIVRVQGNVTP
jgi:hypothetical protein